MCDLWQKRNESITNLSSLPITILLPNCQANIISGDNDFYAAKKKKNIYQKHSSIKLQESTTRIYPHKFCLEKGLESTMQQTINVTTYHYHFESLN